MNRRPLLLCLIAAAFLVLGIEVRFEHRNIVEEYWEGWIPIVYCGIAALTSLAALTKYAAMRSLATTVFAVGIGAGLFGMYKHTDGNLARFTELFTLKTERRNLPPALAPAAVAGLAALGLVISTSSKTR
ncbi:MAG: hypothetical protein KIT11_08225 [Fimbriimonadaceae bacterium]|nr:hypothetical protein [Fimbriimonadaceae bacterium]QYK56339.1 MAG: hypothetical protein KF733_02420 [Fimbriimonadaceae bacterium]